MIKAVIFDIFGVIYPDTFWSIVHKHIPDVGLRYQEFRDLLRRSDLGHMESDQFWDEAAAAIGITRAQVDADLKEIRGPDPELMSYIQELKTRLYKTSIISNIGRGALETIFKDYDSKQLFDDMVLSNEIGLLKPDLLIYGSAADRLSLLPQECAFVDDREVNVKGATDAGMTGLLYTNCSKLRRDLEPLLNDTDYHSALQAG